MNNCGFVTIVTTLLAFSASALAQSHVPADIKEKTEAAFSPAYFGHGETSVVGRLQIPADRKDETYDVVIACQAIIDRDGAARDFHCIAPESYEHFADAVLKAIEGAVFIPARIDGSPVEVLMNFMALIRCAENAGCNSSLIPNHGRNINEFGLAYSLPQPVLEAKGWYEKYEQKLEWIASGKPYRDVGSYKFLVSTMVDESGKASKSRIDYVARTTMGRYGKPAKSTAKSLLSVRFIPGYYRAQPASMRFYEYWVDPHGAPYENRMPLKSLGSVPPRYPRAAAKPSNRTPLPNPKPLPRPGG